MDLQKVLRELGLEGKPALSVKQVHTIINKVIVLNSKESVVNEQAPVLTFKVARPKTLKKGDLFIGHSVNGKQRPFVVYKVMGDMALTIPLTTTEDAYALVPHNSRFSEKGFLCNHFAVVKTEYILKRFVGMFDDNRSINKAAKLITEKTLKELS